MDESDQSTSQQLEEIINSKVNSKSIQ